MLFLLVVHLSFFGVFLIVGGQFFGPIQHVEWPSVRERRTLIGSSA